MGEFCPNSTTMVSRVMEAGCLKGKEKHNDDGKPDYMVSGSNRIRGKVVLMKKNVLDFNDLKASFVDRIHELLSKGVSMQLISATHPEPVANGFGLRGKLGRVAYLEKWVTTITSSSAGETNFPISLDWDESHGVPGALLIRNHHHSQFYLKTITLADVPGHGLLHFVCNSWVYPAHRYKYNRIFFPNKV